MFGKTRCPYCGHTAKHPRDSHREEENRRIYGSEQGKQLSKMLAARSGYVSKTGKEKLYVCANCDYHFGLRQSKDWQASATMLGNEMAVRQYKELIDELNQSLEELQDEPDQSSEELLRD